MQDEDGSRSSGVEWVLLATLIIFCLVATASCALYGWMVSLK